MTKNKEFTWGMLHKTIGESPATATKTSAQWQRCVIINHYFGFDISLGCATKNSDKGCLTNVSEHGFDVFATAPKLATKLLCASFCIGFRTREAEILSQWQVQETTKCKKLNHEVLGRRGFSHATVDAYFSTKGFCGIQDFAQLVQRFKDEVDCFVILSKQMEAKQGERECVWRSLQGWNRSSIEWNQFHECDACGRALTLFSFGGSYLFIRRLQTKEDSACENLLAKDNQICYKLFLCDQFFWISEQQFQTTNRYFNKINHASWNHFGFLKSVLLIIDFRFWGCSWEIDVL